MTTYLMYDSVWPEGIPGRAWAVAGYADGHYNWTVAQWERFLNSWRLPITVLGGHTGARIVDCERGDLTPGGAAQWCAIEARDYQRRPTVYCNRSTYPLLVRALGVFGMMFGRDASLWLAAPDGVATLSVPGDPTDYAGLVAKQYGEGPGAAYDLSVVNPMWVESIAVGGPLPTPPVLTTVVVFSPSGNVTTDLPGLKELVAGGLPDATGVDVTSNGVVMDTDVGSLRAAGVV